jgi:hypothetical protein
VLDRTLVIPCSADLQEPRERPVARTLVDKSSLHVSTINTRPASWLLPAPCQATYRGGCGAELRPNHHPHCQRCQPTLFIHRPWPHILPAPVLIACAGVSSHVTFGWSRPTRMPQSTHSTRPWRGVAPSRRRSLRSSSLQGEQTDCKRKPLIKDTERG